MADLVERMRQRFYPESLPVLASYWLKTVYQQGYELRFWKKTDFLLKKAVLERPAGGEMALQAFRELQSWIEEAVLGPGQAPHAAATRLEPARTIDPERLPYFLCRVLNEWLPVEVSRLLTDESDSPYWQEGGIPVLAIATALERLLLRERLSAETLEMLLQPELYNPRLIYPADAEILRDVVLCLLGRTPAAPAPVLPAILLGVASGAPLPPDYSEAVRRTSLARGPGGDQLRVPLSSDEAREILKSDHLQIGSILVTMDGRWWQSDKLQYGDHDAAIYRPAGRLRIDHSADHAKLDVPWPEGRSLWSGPVAFRDRFELFGREWRVDRWEQTGDQTWLHLVFSRALSIAAPARGRVASPAPRSAAAALRPKQSVLRSKTPAII